VNPIDLPRLAKGFDEFGRTHCGQEPVYAALCALLAREPERLGVLRGAEPTQRRPNLLLAALHVLVLREPASPIAAYFRSAGGTRDVDALFDDRARAFFDAHAGALEALCAARTTQTNEIGRCAVLWPAVLEGLARAGGRACALYDFGASAGLNLGLDTYGIDYDGVHVRPGAEPRIACRLEGPGRFAFAGDVHVIERLGVDVAPIDLRDAAAREWLVACVWPHDTARRARLEQAIDVALARRFHVERARDGLELLEERIAGLPAEVTPIVFHSWVLNYIPAAERRTAIARLHALVRDRRAIWISGEGDEVVLDPSLPPCPSFETQWVLTTTEGQRVIAHSHPHGAWLRWQA
jgi:hypothetical protein